MKIHSKFVTFECHVLNQQQDFLLLIFPFFPPLNRPHSSCFYYLNDHIFSPANRIYLIHPAISNNLSIVTLVFLLFKFPFLQDWSILKMPHLAQAFWKFSYTNFAKEVPEVNCLGFPCCQTQVALHNTFSLNSYAVILLFKWQAEVIGIPWWGLKYTVAIKTHLDDLLQHFQIFGRTYTKSN